MLITLRVLRVNANFPASETCVKMINQDDINRKRVADLTCLSKDATETRLL